MQIFRYATTRDMHCWWVLVQVLVLVLVLVLGRDLLLPVRHLSAQVESIWIVAFPTPLFPFLCAPYCDMVSFRASQFILSAPRIPPDHLTGIR